MVAIISGNNTGLKLSSWTALGAKGRMGDPRMGNSGESVYVTAVTAIFPFTAACLPVSFGK